MQPRITMNAGICVFDKKTEKFVHYCAYPTTPSQLDIDMLKKELVEDPEFAFEPGSFVMAHTTPEQVAYFQTVFDDAADNDEIRYNDD